MTNYEVQLEQSKRKDRSKFRFSNLLSRYSVVGMGWSDSGPMGVVPGTSNEALAAALAPAARTLQPASG